MTLWVAYYLTFVAGFCYRVLHSIVPQDNQHQKKQLDRHGKTATEVIFPREYMNDPIFELRRKI